MKKILLAAALAFPLVLAPLAVLAAERSAVPPGYRATSLPMKSHQLRFIEAGDRVDLMTVFAARLGEKGKERPETVTATILQNVLVLAVDHAEGAVLLALNPNEAQYAALFASRQDGLWLTRRGAGDAEMPPMEMASDRKLFR